ncbi:MAG TPA: ABC transporter permease subunit [Chthoniobacteraceae bacterium]|jgi:ABC-2 type transport system permease protein|nr:ABC transporter permease subunit [Chthoniobacteraceae bacterium]
MSETTATTTATPAVETKEAGTSARHWSPILTIAKRELSGYFASPVAFVFIVIFLLASGFFTFMVGGFFERGQATLETFFTWHPWLFLIFVSAIGMGMWSEERRAGTIELLLTMPIAPWQAIVGKFLAGWTVIGLALVLTFPVWITVNYLGHPDNGVIFASYLGTFLLAGANLSITAMISALTRSQIAAFIISVVLSLFLILAGYPPVTNLAMGWARFPWIIDAVASFSVMTHFESIQKGVLDSRDLIYFLSVIVFSLFTTSVIVRAHRAG